jgi:hypothetical protein
MTTDRPSDGTGIPADAVAAVPEPTPAQGKPLTPAAQRALAEAAERRAAQAEKEAALAREGELRGRGGLDPVRYDDWEIKGLTSDF